MQSRQTKNGYAFNAIMLLVISFCVTLTQSCTSSVGSKKELIVQKAKTCKIPYFDTTGYVKKYFKSRGMTYPLSISRFPVINDVGYLVNKSIGYLADSLQFYDKPVAISDIVISGDTLAYKIELYKVNCTFDCQPFHVDFSRFEDSNRIIVHSNIAFFNVVNKQVVFVGFAN
jgi:hypothetical protein